MPGLFGPTPQEIQDSRGVGRLNTLSQLATIPLGRLGGGMAGLLAGQAFREATGGDPELKKASLLKEAQEEIRATGLQLGDPGFRPKVIAALQKRGLAREAEQASIRALQAEKIVAERGKAQQGLRREFALATTAEAEAGTAAQTSALNLQKLLADTKLKTFEAGAAPERLKNETANLLARTKSALASANAGNSQAARTRAGIRLDEMSASTQMLDRIAKASTDELNNSSKLLDKWRTDARSAVAAEDSWNRFQALAAERSPAGDTGLLVAYAKMLDPESVASKSEVDAVAGALTGLLGRVKKQITALGSVDAAVLTESERDLLISAASALAQTNVEKFNLVNSQYTELAQRLGVDPRNVVLQQPTAVPTTGTRTPASGGSIPVYNPATGEFE